MRRRELLVAVLACGSRVLARPSQGIHWPAFRGPNSSGVGEGFPVASSWNADHASGPNVNVLWETPLDGLGHSSPIIWGDRIFLATAVSQAGKPVLRLGLYGDSTAAQNEGQQHWKLVCLDKRTGKLRWERTVRKGSPRATRHIKATNANTTLATDGRRLVGFFGSEGLYCCNLDGKVLWERDLGTIDVGKYGIGWGYASSPALHGERIVVQCDSAESPFIAALHVADGRELWRTSRKGVCDRSWGTPFVYSDGSRTQVVTNGYPFIASYDLATGAEFWRLRNEGDNPIPTPFGSGGLIFVASSHGGKAPLYAIRPNARGDISLAGDARSNDAVVWSQEQNGAYIQTPVAYRQWIFSGTNNGVVKCYEAATGRMLFQERLSGGSTGFSASPVAADGKVYFSSEDGDVFVLAAAPEYRLLATNRLGDPCMATPALSEGVLYFRTLAKVVAIGGLES